ncbi:MAG: XdhC/CoxF family protein [Rhodobiaceae bacterium]|nr:XdhC/CoxF family protein [Rhodobiaceae bacterium]RPF96828.1 MAG: XdhC family protein [Rhizobiales bacterium TMED227]|tara:strand:+ start:1158 stop:1832 length:675 start_codon:yes stop_codon:yes gene_type:complete
MQKSNLDKIIENQKLRKSVICLTNIDSDEETILLKGESSRIEGLDQEIAQCVRYDSSKLVNVNGNNYFIDVYNPPLKLIIIGAVHIAQYLVDFAQNLSFDCKLIDPREGFANKERFPNTEIYNNWPDEVMESMGIDNRTAIVTLTHDPKIDDVALDFVLKKDCFYIGSLGSKKTHAARIERMSAKFSDEDIQKIHGPIGIDIGARSPSEIALSIISEIILSLRK